jgi:cell wall-associated NlpC family hydrolase
MVITNLNKVNASSLETTLLGSDSSYGDLIAEIGRLFINKPYKAETLENPGKEKLIVNVSCFDCTTFVETVLALARCASAGIISRDALRKNLKSIRYRQGKIDGYSSRLHYFTDWLRDDENKNILTDVSRNLGGEPQRKKINFMTAHRESYAALKNKAQLAKMLVVEKNISRKISYIIEKDRFSEQKAKIQNGDVIAFATNQEGLDVTHVGFAIWQGRSLHLLHASSKEGGVVVSKKTLTSYLKSNKKFTGIIVARPK